MIEINSSPDRRDLDDVHARAAAAAGVAIIVDSDAHGSETLANVRWGVATPPHRPPRPPPWLARPRSPTRSPWSEVRAAAQARMRGAGGRHVAAGGGPPPSFS